MKVAGLAYQYCMLENTSKRQIYAVKVCHFDNSLLLDLYQIVHGDMSNTEPGLLYKHRSNKSYGISTDSNKYGKEE